MTRGCTTKADTFRMRVRSGRSNLVAAAMLLPSLVASLPTIQVCHLTPADRDLFYRCLLFGPAVATASEDAACETAATNACHEGSCPLVKECGASCPLAQPRP